MKSEVWNIEKLKTWDKNPRDITPEDLERLKTQIKKHEQYKPLVVAEDGTVLGGNMRLKAFKELGVTEVWVSIVHAPDEQTKVEIALSDNDRAGFYLVDKANELIMSVPGLDLEAYKLDLGNPTSLADLSLFLSEDNSEEDLENHLKLTEGTELIKILTTTETAQKVKELIETNRQGEADDGLVLLKLIE